MNLTQFLPQTQCQLIGFIFWVICHSIVEFYLGRTTRIQAASIPELIFNLIKATYSLIHKPKTGEP